jgi:hypothetical protein
MNGELAFSILVIYLMIGFLSAILMVVFELYIEYRDYPDQIIETLGSLNIVTVFKSWVNRHQPDPIITVLVITVLFWWALVPYYIYQYFIYQSELKVMTTVNKSDRD